MKYLINLITFISIANAGFLDLRHDAQPLIAQVVNEFKATLIRHPVKLHSAMKTKRDLTIVKLERDIQTDLCQSLQNELQNVLDQIQTSMDHGQNVAQSLLDKAKELSNKIKELGGNVVDMGHQFLLSLLEHGQNILGNLLGNLGIGKRDFLGSAMGGTNGLATQLLDQLDLENLLQKLLNSILGGIGKKRDIVGDLIGGLLNQVLGNLDLNSIPIMGNLLGFLGIGKRDVAPRTWSYIFDTASQVLSSIAAKLMDFKEWIHLVTNHSLSSVQGHIQNIKDFALQIVQHANELTANSIQQATEYFEPYQNDLGYLWIQIQDAARDVQQQIIG